MREEPLGLAQERALALHAAQPLQEGEGQHLRVREALGGLVAPRAARVDGTVGVVYEAEKDGRSLFREGEAWGKVVSGHPVLL